MGDHVGETGRTDDGSGRRWWEDAVLPGWPRSEEELVAFQHALAREAARQDRWEPARGTLLVIGAAFAVLPTGVTGYGRAGMPVHAAAVLLRDRREIAAAVVAGRARAPYRPGLLALQHGPLLEEAIRRLPHLPDVLMVNATGLDHPRRAGLALHLGFVLGTPTIGVTDRPLVAPATDPEGRRGDAAPLELAGQMVGYSVRTKQGVRPVVAHAAWRTSPETARDLVLRTVARARTPEPLRSARRLARSARATDEGRRRPRPGGVA